LSYQISWEKHGVVEKFYDFITPRELISCNEDVCRDSRFDAIKYQLFDLAEVKLAETTDTAKALRLVQRIAAIDNAAAKSNPNVKIAVVTRIESLGSLASFYSLELSDSSWVCEIFETEEAAREWLAVPP